MPRRVSGRRRKRWCVAIPRLCGRDWNSSRLTGSNAYTTAGRGSPRAISSAGITRVVPAPSVRSVSKPLPFRRDSWKGDCASTRMEPFDLQQFPRRGEETATACHAEGRGFESHQPLSKRPAFAGLFCVRSRLVRLRRVGLTPDSPRADRPPFPGKCPVCRLILVRPNRSPSAGLQKVECSPAAAVGRLFLQTARSCARSLPARCQRSRSSRVSPVSVRRPLGRPWRAQRPRRAVGSGERALRCVARDERDFTPDDPTTCSDDELAWADGRLTRAVGGQP